MSVAPKGFFKIPTGIRTFPTTCEKPQQYAPVGPWAAKLEIHRHKDPAQSNMIVKCKVVCNFIHGQVMCT